MLRKILIMLVFVLISIMIFNCLDNEFESDNSPELISQFPIETKIDENVNKEIKFIAIFDDPDGDHMRFFGLLNNDDIPLDIDGNTAKFSFKFKEKGIYRLQIVGYNTFSDTAEWNITVKDTLKLKTIEYGIRCGWCTVDDLLTINEDSTVFSQSFDCSNDWIDTVGITTDTLWKEILHLFDLEKFLAIDFYDSGLPWDGCAQKILAKNDTVKHLIVFQWKTQPEIQPIRPLIEKMLINMYNLYKSKT